MNQAKIKRTLVLGVIGTLVAASLLLVPADPALARTNYSFGFNFNVPLGIYPMYGYPYQAPMYYPQVPYRQVPMYYPQVPYQMYPPCARVWTPGYYDAYGNWVFGYYRYACNHYGY